MKTQYAKTSKGSTLRRKFIEETTYIKNKERSPNQHPNFIPLGMGGGELNPVLAEESK